jgi:hypothetical protein
MMRLPPLRGPSPALRSSSLNPIVARGLWDQAMREAGETLTREIVGDESERAARVRRGSAEMLGLTPAGFKRYVAVVELEDHDADIIRFWEWCAPQLAQEAVKALNNLAATNPGLPPVEFALPKKREPYTFSWDKYPETLGREVRQVIEDRAEIDDALVDIADVE